MESFRDDVLYKLNVEFNCVDFHHETQAFSVNNRFEGSGL